MVEPTHGFSRQAIGAALSDVVVVAGPDGTHAEYISTALAHDRRVIAVEPMGIDGAPVGTAWPMPDQ